MTVYYSRHNKIENTFIEKFEQAAIKAKFGKDTEIIRGSLQNDDIERKIKRADAFVLSTIHGASDELGFREAEYAVLEKKKIFYFYDSLIKPVTSYKFSRFYKKNNDLYAFLYPVFTPLVPNVSNGTLG